MQMCFPACTEHIQEEQCEVELMLDAFCTLQVDLVVATPKRLAHLIKAKQIHLASLQFLILDEADKLFELGFVTHIDAIIHACSNPGIVSAWPLALKSNFHFCFCSSLVILSKFGCMSSNVFWHIIQRGHASFCDCV